MVKQGKATAVRPSEPASLVNDLVQNPVPLLLVAEGKGNLKLSQFQAVFRARPTKVKHDECADDAIAGWLHIHLHLKAAARGQRHTTTDISQHTHIRQGAHLQEQQQKQQQQSNSNILFSRSLKQVYGSTAVLVGKLIPPKRYTWCEQGVLPTKHATGCTQPMQWMSVLPLSHAMLHSV